MGWRRSCSTSIMQVERPSEGQYFMQVKWYFAPAGAKTFYGLNAFESGLWDREQIEQPHALGEQPPYDSPWYNGANVWGYVGQCMVGTPDQFANGLSAADLASPPLPFALIPSCCKPPTTIGPAIGFAFDWPDPQFTYPVNPGFTGFRFDFLNPTPPGPGTRIGLGWRFDFLDPTPPGAGQVVPLGWRFTWFDPSQPPPPQPVLIGFRFDWQQPFPPGPPPRVLLGFDFDWLDPTPPGPGPQIGLGWRFDWLDPTHPAPTDNVEVGFRFDWLDPTPPGPGPLIGLGWDFDWLNPTPPGPGPLIGLGWDFDWFDPTPPGPGPLIGLGWDFDWLDPSSTAGGQNLELGLRFSWFADVAASTIVTPCNPAGTAATMHVALSTIGPPSPFDGTYLVTWNAVDSRWEFHAAGYTVYVQCNTVIGPHSWVVGVVQGAADQYGIITATVGPPFGSTMWGGTWPSGTYFLMGVVSP